MANIETDAYGRVILERLTPEGWNTLFPSWCNHLVYACRGNCWVCFERKPELHREVAPHWEADGMSHVIYDTPRIAPPAHWETSWVARPTDSKVVLEIPLPMSIQGNIVPSALSIEAWNALFPDWCRHLAMDLCGREYDDGPVWRMYEYQPERKSNGFGMCTKWEVRGGHVEAVTHVKLQETEWSASHVQRPGKW